MNEKKTFGQKLEAFIGGRGFYIVLSVCLVVIGVSAYVLIAGSGIYVDTDTQELSMPEETTVIAPQQLIENPASRAALIPTQAPPAEEVGNWSPEQAETASTAELIWPLDGIITSDYSVSALTFSEKFGDWRTHAGVDIAAPAGTQVMCVTAGVVESVGTTSLGGTTVVIEHAGGLKSIYANLQETPAVAEGDNVMTGEVIGAVGATAPGETKENPHLLFSMSLDGQSVNPADCLPKR